MPFWRFTWLTAAGCIPWVFALGLLGREVGSRWDVWKDRLHTAQVARVQGSGTQFFSGWAAYVLASGFASLIAAFLGPEPALLTAIQAGGAGATYGFLSGWVIGAASLGGRA